MPDIDEMWSGTREALTVQRVFGEAYEQDGTTVIPVARVRGGAGGGGDANAAGGGGFGLTARPAGTYVIRDGEVSWKPAVDPSRVVVGWQLVSALALLVAWAFARSLRPR